MRTHRPWGLHFFGSCLLAAAVAATVMAQTTYPPNGPSIPPVTLTGGGSPPPTAAPAPGARDRASQWNMELVGHNDLQGRSAYQPIIINQDGRQIAYVGHHNNQKPLMNPLTGKAEVNGTSIVDVTDPAKTRYLAHIATGEDRRTGGAQMARVCSGNTLPKGVKGKWYLLRPLGGSAHEIWDVTDPAKPTKLTTVVDNLTGTHKSWWECDTGIAYLVATNSKEGWRGGNHLKIYDLSDPAKPVYIRDFGMVGTQPNASGSEAGEGIHGAISAGPEKNRVYIAYGTGNDGVVSIVDRKKLLTEFKNPLTPTEAELLAPQVGYIHMSPDQGAHTTFPIFGVPIPGFQGHQALRKRDLLLVVSEAARADNCGQNFPSDQLTQGRAAPISRSCSISRTNRRPGRYRPSGCRRRRGTTVAEAGGSAPTPPLSRSIPRTTARSLSLRGSTRACASGIFATRLPFTRSAISFRRQIRTPFRPARTPKRKRAASSARRRPPAGARAWESQTTWGSTTAV